MGVVDEGVYDSDGGVGDYVGGSGAEGSVWDEKMRRVSIMNPVSCLSVVASS